MPDIVFTDLDHARHTAPNINTAVHATMRAVYLKEISIFSTDLGPNVMPINSNLATGASHRCL